MIFALTVARHTFQQVVLFLLIISGSAIFVSIGIIHIRRKAFEIRLEELAARKRKSRPGRALTFSLSRRRAPATSSQLETDIASGAVRGRAIKEDASASQGDGAAFEHGGDRPANSSFARPASDDVPLESLVSRSSTFTANHASQRGTEGDDGATTGPNDRIRFMDEPRRPEETDGPASESYGPRQALHRRHTRLFEGSGVGVRGTAQHPRNARPLTGLPMSEITEHEEKLFHSKSGSIAGFGKYIGSNGYIGRNSQFHNLTERERRKLGGIEYDAICLLSWVVPIYFVIWQLAGAIGMGVWIQINRPGVALSNGQPCNA